MKKSFLAIAAVGLMGLSSISFAAPYSLGAIDFSGFEDLTPDTSTQNVFTFNGGSDLFVFWNSPTGGTAYVGEDDNSMDFLAGFSSLEATIKNSSGDASFGLFVNTGNDFSGAGLTQTAMIDVLEDQVVDLSLDLSGVDLNSVKSYGVVITSDNQVAHAKVPEPSSIATLGAGLLALAFVARRNKKKAL